MVLSISVSGLAVSPETAGAGGCTACREGEGEGVGVDQRLKESRDAVKLLRMWW